MLDALTINDYFLQSNYLESIFKYFLEPRATLNRSHYFHRIPEKKIRDSRRGMVNPAPLAFTYSKPILSLKVRRQV